MEPERQFAGAPHLIGCHDSRAADRLSTVHQDCCGNTISLVILIIKSEIQRHDGQALSISICHFDDVASGDNRSDLLGVGHLTIRATHHTMLAGNRPLILTLGRFASARDILHAHA